MISVSEAVSRGLALALGPQQDRDLDTCCRGGETISIMRIFHYLPYDEEHGIKNKPARYRPQRSETAVEHEEPTIGSSVSRGAPDEVATNTCTTVCTAENILTVQFLNI